MIKLWETLNEISENYRLVLLPSYVYALLHVYLWRIYPEKSGMAIDKIGWMEISPFWDEIVDRSFIQEHLN